MPHEFSANWSSFAYSYFYIWISSSFGDFFHYFAIQPTGSKIKPNRHYSWSTDFSFLCNFKTRDWEVKREREEAGKKTRKTRHELSNAIWSCHCGASKWICDVYINGASLLPSNAIKVEHTTVEHWPNGKIVAHWAMELAKWRINGRQLSRISCISSKFIKMLLNSLKFNEANATAESKWTHDRYVCICLCGEIRWMEKEQEKHKINKKKKKKASCRY